MTNGTAIIIGVGPGLGLALARTFAAAGHPTALLARNPDRLDQYTQELHTPERPARAYATDAADPASLRTAIHAATTDLGAPEVMVYNAALLRTDTPTDGDDTGWNNALAVDVLGAKISAETVLPQLRDGRGSLLFTGGGLALAPSPDYASVSVGKAALRAYVQALHSQLTGTEVHATSVTITGFIGGGEERFDPSVLAQAYLDLHHQPTTDWKPELLRD
jgi:NAD(P)-dependent dehydrogenase (short-subunit alcohol dehydrogenase family)